MKTLKKPVAALLLFFVTILWGSAYTVIKIIIDAGMSVGLLNVFRGFGLALLIFAVFGNKIIKMKKKEAIIGIAAGLTNSLGYLFQSIGLKYTTPSTGAFLTILYTVFVPVIALLIFRVRPSIKLIPAIALSVAGTFILTGMSFDSLTLGKGELFSLGCALSFAFSIAILSNTGEGVSPEPIAFWMGIMHGITGLVYFFALEKGGIGAVSWTKIIIPIAYMVLMVSFASTTSQVISQKSLDASTAAIIMTMEAVFGTLISLLTGYDKFGWSLIGGGALIFLGVIIILLPPIDKLKKRFALHKKDGIN